METKTCSVCKVAKPTTEFSPSKPGLFGRHSQCKPCKTLRQRAYYRTPAGRAASRRNHEKYKSQGRYWYTPGEPLRAVLLNRRYGITSAAYDQMLASQNGRCAICEASTPSKKLKKFIVDHCHKTGAVRGLLCYACNTRLGKMGDSIELFSRFVKYLSPR